jgi:DICT domain-containing protein
VYFLSELLLLCHELLDEVDAAVDDRSLIAAAVAVKRNQTPQLLQTVLDLRTTLFVSQTSLRPSRTFILHVRLQQTIAEIGQRREM